MGKKDFQQLFLVKNFIEKKHKTKVIGCKTIRDKNKFALSSRNYLFNKDDLNVAGNISKMFFLVKKMLKKTKTQINYYLKQKKICKKNLKLRLNIWN